MVASERTGQAEWLKAVPKAAVQHEETPEGLIILLRPKFLSPRWAWLQRMMWKPYFRVKLDEVGSHLWRQVDGKQNVAALAESQRRVFGERAEPAEERVIAFLRQLAQGGFLSLYRPNQES